MTVIAGVNLCSADAFWPVGISRALGLGRAREANLVGKSGRVFGVDISEQLLARARERVVEMGFSQVTLKLADAGTYPLEPENFDHIYSRLGIMFFIALSEPSSWLPA